MICHCYPPEWSESVVAIGTKNAEEDFVADSTGFSVNMEERDSDQKILLPKNFNGVMPNSLIVTNRHVFDGKSDVVLIRFNDKLQANTFTERTQKELCWTKP